MTSTSSASGITQTPAALVWMRPWLSVTGTRCTRCTPPSNFSRAHGASPGCGGAARLHRDAHVLVAAEVALGGVEHLGAPAPALGVPQVHPQQVAGEQRRLLAALPRLDLEDDVAVVVGVARDQQPAQPVLGGGQGGLERRDLLGEGGVLGGQLAGRAEVVAGADPGVVGGHGRAERGVPLAQLAAAVGVGGDLRVAHLALERGVLVDEGLRGVEHGGLRWSGGSVVPVGGRKRDAPAHPGGVDRRGRGSYLAATFLP